MATALDVITKALGLTNAVGIDQTLTAAEAQLGLDAFNALLEEWSIEGLAVYAQADQTFNTVANQAVYTIGTGGNWSTTRPISITSPAYSVINSVSFPCVSMTKEEYATIAVKGQTQTYPERFLYENVYPLGLVTLYPTPSAITPITFIIDRVLTPLATLATTLSFPPGYAKAFQYALGVELAPLFGKKSSEYTDIVRIANRTLMHIKRANHRQRVMVCGPEYSDNDNQWYCIQRVW